MTEVAVSAQRAPSPGDLRQLGRGDVVAIYRGAELRPDWTSLLCALPVAVARGADVVWRPACSA